MFIGDHEENQQAQVQDLVSHDLDVLDPWLRIHDRVTVIGDSRLYARSTRHVPKGRINVSPARCPTVIFLGRR